MIYYGIHAIPAPGQAGALAGAVAPYQKLLSAHGAKSVESFVISAGQNVGSLFHIVGYENSTDAEKVRDAVRDDPEWKDLQTKIGSMVASLSINTLDALT
jgi:hypothetical protein